MRAPISFLLLCVIFSTLTSAHRPNGKVQDMAWLVGRWTMDKGQSQLLEEWTIENDSTLAGKSLFIKNRTDTSLQETVQLAFRKNKWYYTPTVQGQNNNQPVQFVVIYQKGTEFIAENPSHDFPKRISYRRLNDQLFASIEGYLFISIDGIREKGYRKANFDFSLEK